MKSIRLILSAAIASALLVTAAPGFAKDGDGRVIRTASCTGASNIKLKAKPEDGRLEVDLDVDQNKAGVKWRWGIRRNGKRVARGTRTTKAPSGSFSVERRIANPAGEDRIRGLARRDGETCRVSLRI